jgi:hypothetical protein
MRGTSLSQSCPLDKKAKQVNTGTRICSQHHGTVRSMLLVLTPGTIFTNLSIVAHMDLTGPSAKTPKTKTKLSGFSPQANYTDLGTEACRRN